MRKFDALKSGKSILIFSAALLLSGNAFAQPGAGKSSDAGKSADKAGEAGKSNPAAAGAPQQPRLTVQSLIGDSVGDPASPQYKDVADAITRISNGDLVGARELLETAVKNNPNLPPTSVLIAKILFMANQVAGARAELEKAILNSPNDPEAYTIFAELALRERQITAAELLLLKAKTLADAYTGNAKRKRNFETNIASGLALVAESREQWDAAIAQAKKLIEIDSENASAHQRMGIYLFRQGKGDKKSAEGAYKEFQAAMKADPKANAEIILARLYQSTNDSTNEKKWTDYAVQKYPNDAQVQIAAAQLALQSNRLDEAQKFADTAIRANADAPEAKLLRAGIARLTGDLVKAESLLEQLHLQYPSNMPAANLLAQVLVDQSDTKKQNRGLELAKMNSQAATEGNQTNRDLFATLAWALYRNGQTQAAENAIAQVVNSSGGQMSQDYAYYLTKILLEPKGRYPEAIQVLDGILKSPAPFAYRLAARELLDDIKKRPPPANTPPAGQAPIIPPVTTPNPIPGTP
jgi:tetratricopeptide (TPR) repeat protein